MPEWDELLGQPVVAKWRELGYGGEVRGTLARDDHRWFVVDEDGDRFFLTLSDKVEGVGA